MRIKLHHPLWTHLPALVMVLLMLVALVRVVSLPDPLPVDPDTSERPDRWGATWGIAGVVLLSLSWIGMFVAWDELWARSEHRKTFNWFSLMDEFVVGLNGGALLMAYLGRVDAGNDFPFSCSMLWFVPAVATAAVLEALRPFRPMEEHLTAEDTSALQANIAERMAAGERWTYWEMHSPGWVQALVAVSMALLAAANLALAREFSYWWTSVVPLVMLFLLLLFVLCAGFRVSVTLDRVQVRMGVLGLRVASIGTADIASVLVCEVSPFHDSGPSGIRWGWKRKVYCLGGNQGVKVQTHQGKQYVIGSGHPERLAAVIGATLRVTVSTECTEK